MTTLERLIAEHVLETLTTRQHLRVARASHESLRDELEVAVVPLLSSVTPYLMAAHVHVENASAGFGDHNADEAVAVMIDAIGERLAHSNHIDDIFVDDATLRRDALRATRQVLLKYLRGELAIEADSHARSTYVVQLDGLGYVVASAAARLPEATATRALMRAARAAAAELESFVHATRTASFSATSTDASLLALEEAVTREIGLLVDNGHVVLPCVEQVFELPTAPSPRTGLAAALREAAAQLEQRGTCRAVCERVPPRRVRLAVTPLTAEAAQQADAYFAELVALVEAALDAIHGRPRSPRNADAADAPESAPAVSQTRRRRNAPASAPAKAVHRAPASKRRRAR